MRQIVGVPNLLILPFGCVAQKLPTCGFEAIENIIELFHNTKRDDLVKIELLPKAKKYGFAVSGANGYSIVINGFQHILQDYGISSKWYPFDYRQVIIPALRNNRGVLVVGDAYYLDFKSYPKQKSWHAFVLTNYYIDESGYYIMGYIGIDSNFRNKEIAWPYQNVESAAQGASQYVISTPVLITDKSINYPITAKYYQMTRTGEIIPIYDHQL